jgi:hypothetical protein
MKLMLMWQMRSVMIENLQASTARVLANSVRHRLRTRFGPVLYASQGFFASQAASVLIIVAKRTSAIRMNLCRAQLEHDTIPVLAAPILVSYFNRNVECHGDRFVRSCFVCNDAEYTVCIRYRRTDPVSMYLHLLIFYL